MLFRLLETFLVALCTSQKAFQAIRENHKFPIEIFPPENALFTSLRIYTWKFLISPQNSDPSPRISEMPTFLRDSLISLFCWRRKRNINRNTLSIWRGLEIKIAVTKVVLQPSDWNLPGVPSYEILFGYYSMSKSTSKAYIHCKQMFGLFLQDWICFFQTFPLVASIIHFSGYC